MTKNEILVKRLTEWINMLDMQSFENKRTYNAVRSVVGSMTTVRKALNERIVEKRSRL